MEVFCKLKSIHIAKRLNIILGTLRFNVNFCNGTIKNRAIKNIKTHDTYDNEKDIIATARHPAAAHERRSAGTLCRAQQRQEDPYILLRHEQEQPQRDGVREYVNRYWRLCS